MTESGAQDETARVLRRASMDRDPVLGFRLQRRAASASRGRGPLRVLTACRCRGTGTRAAPAVQAGPARGCRSGHRGRAVERDGRLRDRGRPARSRSGQLIGTTASTYVWPWARTQASSSVACASSRWFSNAAARPPSGSGGIGVTQSKREAGGADQSTRQRGESAAAVSRATGAAGLQRSREVEAREGRRARDREGRYWTCDQFADFRRGPLEADQRPTVGLVLHGHRGQSSGPDRAACGDQRGDFWLGPVRCRALSDTVGSVCWWLGMVRRPPPPSPRRSRA